MYIYIYGKIKKNNNSKLQSCVICFFRQQKKKKKESEKSNRYILIYICIYIPISNSVQIFNFINSTKFVIRISLL